MTFFEFSIFLWSGMIIRRLYNSYLEAMYFTHPQYRTQPPKEHALKKGKDLCGREQEQLDTLLYHDRITTITQIGLEVAIYFTIPGFFPENIPVNSPFYVRLIRLALNHYLLSFTMYWMHRSLHVIPWLWRNIHSIHHWAKHPLSRNTYEDHWFDNFCNAIVGHGCAQILIPLDRQFFYFSRIFRILESLEKHSGISCGLNICHKLQQWLPYAQMPHHHDWHHEGHKSCNFTFASVGGIWDCIFNTRKAGRANRHLSVATAFDHSQMNSKRPSSSSDSILCLVPVVFVVSAAAIKILL